MSKRKLKATACLDGGLSTPGFGAVRRGVEST